MTLSYTPQRQTAVTAYFRSKQLLLFACVGWHLALGPPECASAWSARREQEGCRLLTGARAVCRLLREALNTAGCTAGCRTTLCHTDPRVPHNLRIAGVTGINLCSCLRAPLPSGFTITVRPGSPWIWCEIASGSTERERESQRECWKGRRCKMGARLPEGVPLSTSPGIRPCRPRVVMLRALIWVYVVLLPAPHGPVLVTEAYSDEDFYVGKCTNYLSSSTYEISETPKKLLEIHIRSNIRVSHTCLASAQQTRDVEPMLG